MNKSDEIEAEMFDWENLDALQEKRLELTKEFTVAAIRSGQLELQSLDAGVADRSNLYAKRIQNLVTATLMAIENEG